MARQISELNVEDYIILKGYTFEVSFDVYEPIATQLSALIEYLKSEGLGSDSGSISDYDSSIYDNTDVMKSSTDSFVSQCEEKDTTEKANAESNTIAVDSVDETLTSPVDDEKPIQIKSDPNSSPDSSTSDTPDENATFGGFWTKIKDIENESNESMLHSKTVENQPEATSSNNEIIKVTDLEREFFSEESDSSEDRPLEKVSKQSASQHVCLNIRRKSGILRSRPTNKRASELHERKLPANTDITRAKAKEQRTDSQSNTNRNYTNRNYSNRRWAYQTSTQRQKHRGSFRSSHGRIRGKENNYNTTEFQHLSEKSVRAHRDRFTDRIQPTSECSENKPSTVSVSLQPSPLVLHSQNMWSSNIDIIKSSAKKNMANFRHTERVSSQAFNHYEVGRFLMEGEPSIL